MRTFASKSFQSHAEVLEELVYTVCLILQRLGQIPKTLSCQDQEVVVLGFHTRQVSQSLTLTFFASGQTRENSSIIISRAHDPWQLSVQWHILLYFPAC